MGRTLKRVPLDFDWPQGKVWGGYLNPFSSQSIDCHHCDGSGYGPDAKRFADQWYGNAPFSPAEYGARPLRVDDEAVQAFARHNVERSPEFLGSGEAAIQREARRLWEHWRGSWVHHLIQADVDALVAQGRIRGLGDAPTAEQVNVAYLSGIGHDAINRWICIEARCAREGVALECARCAGKGHLWPSPEVERQHDEWQPAEPPAGEGFQLWETTSEGSPSSPVFASIEALCEYAAEHCTTFADYKASAEDWRRMLDADFVCHAEGGNIFL